MAKEDLLQVDGLETSNNRLSKNANQANVPSYSDRDWLETTDPTPYHEISGNASSKYDQAREARVQEGLSMLANIQLNGKPVINPLLLLLGKWWEVKPARTEVKRLIDEEAKSLNINPNTYLQEVLGDEIEALKNFQTAIDRVKYGKTYYIPRESKKKVEMKNLSVEGIVYKVPVSMLVELKEKHGTDTKKISSFIKKNCEKFEVEEL